jgi:hypothetical protein
MNDTIDRQRPHRQTLSLRGPMRGVTRRPIKHVVPTGTAAPREEDGVPISHVNWRVHSRRPTRRFATLEAAREAAAKLRALYPGEVIYTYQLILIRDEGAQS